MIHPSTEVRHVNDLIGLGVFATERIPKGTITCVVDALDIQVRPDDPLNQHAAYRFCLERFAYANGEGVRILSWDHAKYMNHCCHPNTMLSEFGFEVAIEDIEEGDEMTTEYGLLNMEHDLKLHCEIESCRKIVRQKDFSAHIKSWENRIDEALGSLYKVKQPLMKLMSSQQLENVGKHISTVQA